MVSVAKRLKSVIDGISRVGSVVATVFVVAMMLLIVADVVARRLGGVKGAWEVQELLMVSLVFCSLSYCWLRQGHVRMGLVIERLPPRLRAAADTLAALVGLSLLIVMTWGAFNMTLRDIHTGRTTEWLQIPMWPVEMLFALACALFCLQLIASLIASLVESTG